MKYYLIQTLKGIALSGGLDNAVALSTKELGELLGISQQSASKRILDLLEHGYISRETGYRKQRIRITPQGEEILRREYADLSRIFEYKERLVLRGFVTTGSGEGQYYLQQRMYKNQFTEVLGAEPYEGTLNLRIVGEEATKLEVLRRARGILVSGFRDKGRSFGDVKCFRAKVRNYLCAIVMPKRSHHRDVVELVCKDHLRSKLALSDGDQVEMNITLSPVEPRE